MMEVGNGMSAEQDAAHFTMWCMLASPLVAGNDLRSMSKATAAVLTNRHAIAVNQDPLGRQATLASGAPSSRPASIEATQRAVWDVPLTQVWAKPLAAPAGSIAVALLNRGLNDSATITAEWGAIGAPPAQAYDVLDLWADAASIGSRAGSLSATVAPSSAKMYKLVPKSS
jgi:alpha-galactosidase